MMARHVLAALLLVLAAPAVAEPRAFWPGADYDPAIPDLASVLGHAPGDDITTPEGLVTYLQALKRAAPERTRLVEYARSWEGRPLHYLVVGSREHLARLDEIRAGMRRLADPRDRAAGELEALVAELPAVVWLAHGVHGNEISSADAALLTAYHLLAARDPETAALLDDVLVIIDPAQNPDGRARFVQHYTGLRGLAPQPSPIAAERSEPWPTGRGNHYLFDMNRDWFALTQPEVRGRVQAYLDYYPVVHVDLHEMDTDSSYYFPPPAVPANPYLGNDQEAVLEALGRGTAELFDRFGFRYFSRETFDAYFPGYGDTWPALHGAAGMTFEMASARGLLGQRLDGSLVSYADGVARHFVASMAVLRTAAAERERLLRAFLAQRRGVGDGVTYLLSRERDPGRADALAALLMAQGVEVRQLPEAVRLCGRQVAAGSYAVSTDQPAGRLAGTLLAPESPAGAEFWAEQQRRLDKRLPLEVYDVVAWSLPLLFDVPVTSCRTGAEVFPLANGAPSHAAAPPGEARVAYLVPWGSRAAARFLATALAAGLRLEMATDGFSQNGTEYPRGTLILRRAANAGDLPARVAALARQSGAAITATDTSWVSRGAGFGSDRVRPLRAPRVAIAWGAPTSPYSAGALRYTLEQKLGYPAAPVAVDDLASPWLDQFDVLVLPDGDGYAESLADPVTENLRRWVRRGGTLLAVGGALEYLGPDHADLLSVRPELRAAPGDAAAEDADTPPGAAQAAEPERASTEADAEPSGPVPGTVLATEADLLAAVAPEEPRPPDVPGVLANATVDRDHWLSVGLPARLRFMVAGERIFTPLRLDEGTNVASFAAADGLVAAGHLWEAARRQLARKPVVMVQPQERGHVIGFAADPAFRGMMDGLDVLLANAVFVGPAMVGPVPVAAGPIGGSGLQPRQ